MIKIYKIQILLIFKNIFLLSKQNPPPFRKKKNATILARIILYFICHTDQTFIKFNYKKVINVFHENTE